MGMEILLLWLVVGLVAGVLASLLVGGTGSILADIAVGIGGAFVGGWIFRSVSGDSPGGLGGTILVAFVGAVVLLLVFRLLKGGIGRPRRA